jgi:hypothetical protein
VPDMSTRSRGQEQRRNPRAGSAGLSLDDHRRGDPGEPIAVKPRPVFYILPASAPEFGDWTDCSPGSILNAQVSAVGVLVTPPADDLSTSVVGSASTRLRTIADRAVTARPAPRHAVVKAAATADKSFVIPIEDARSAQARMSQRADAKIHPPGT